MTELYPNTVQRIKRHLPDIRIIFCVRHPLDRIESAWKQCIYSGYNISSNFSEAIHSFPRLFQSGRYLQTLTEYRNAFGVENVNVIFFDDLITNPVGYIKQVTDFIGVDSTNHIDIKPQNVTNSKRIERHYIGWLRGIGVNRILPRGLKRSLPKNLINKPLPKANWNADTRAYAVALISDEIHEFLRQMGKPEDFWKL